MTSFNSYKKRREAIVIGPESAPGTVATKQYSYRWLDKGLKPIPGILENESAMGSDVKVNDSAIDVWHSEGPLGGKVTEDGIGWLATGMLNKVTTTTATLDVPVANTPSTATTGGTLAAATYYYVLVAINASGQTTKSNEVSVVTTGSTSTTTITWAAITGATGYRIYRGTSAGAENTYFAVGAVTTFTDTGAAGTGGTPPVSNTATTSQNKHVFSRDQTIARRTLSVWDVRPVSTRLYKSCYMDNLTVKVEVGEKGAWLEATTALKGWKHADVTGVTPAFKVGEKEFTSRQVAVYLADNVAGLSTGKIKPKSITIQMEEGTTVDHSLGETNDDPEFDSAPAEVKGSMVIKYRKTDFEDDYFINKVHALKVVAINGTSKVEWLGTKVRFRELTDSDGRDDIVTQEISFYFEADDANSGKDIEMTVTNDVASYAA